MKRKFCILISITLLILILLPKSELIGCNICAEPQWGYSYGEFDRYNVDSSNKTASDIVYDPSGMPISPQLIDRLTIEVENCLKLITINGAMPSDVVSNSHCNQQIIQLPIDRQEFIVKIASDWVLNCDGTQQLLPTPVQAGSSGCIAKGLQPNIQCPCRWRAGIKCPNVLIVTPSFYLYKDVLIRFITGCEDPWGSAQLAQCASPSTTPLSDGTDPNNGL